MEIFEEDLKTRVRRKLVITTKIPKELQLVLLKLQNIEIGDIYIKTSTHAKKIKMRDSLLFYLDELYILNIKFSQLLRHKENLEEFVKMLLKAKVEKEMNMCEKKMLSEFARQLEFNEALEFINA